ncbi:MAG TPA: YhjD/YihY/BrkB family envelope integrity protein [Pirellulales bacterium]|jgi:membrane protein|nr:YhjD/YihY/BrkB family envelope integrity protein [Pirellulales bacterium]
MLSWLQQRAWPPVWRTLTEWSADDGNRLAASMAYYGVLSFFPLLLVLLSLFGYIASISPRLQLEQDKLIHLIREETHNGMLADQVQHVLEEVQSQAVVGGPLGVVGILLAAIGIFSQLEDAMYRIWKVKNAPQSGGLWWTVWHVLLHRLKAFAMLLVMGLMLMATFFGSFALGTIEKIAADVPLFASLLEWVHRHMGINVWHLMHFGIGIALNSIFFTLIYKLLAKGPARWPVAASGGFGTAVAWEFGRWVLVQFLVGKKYNPYGIIGALLVIMLWFYYASTILLLGAEFIQVITRRQTEAAHGGSAAAQANSRKIADSTDRPATTD